MLLGCLISEFWVFKIFVILEGNKMYNHDDDRFQLLFNTYPNVCSKISEHFGCSNDDIVVRKEFNEGKSGDVVMQIIIKSGIDLSKNGEYILKISRSSRDDFVNEINNTYNVCIDECRGSIVIPRLEMFNINDPVFYIYDVAGNDLIETSKINQLVPRKKAERLNNILYNLLSVWNMNVIFKSTTVRDLIVECLGEKRLKETSRLNSIVNQLIGDELIMCFKHKNIVLPNPIYFLCNTESVFSKDDAFLQNAIYGKCHGDLNINNIIIQFVGKDKGFLYYLIDFEHYRAEAPLLFDNAYLILSLLLNEPSITGLSDWYDNINIFFSGMFEKNNSNSPDSLSFIMQRSHEALELYIQQNQSHNKREIKIQYLAAHIAAGLNFVNKRNADERQQSFAFLYAGIATRALLNVLNYALPETTDWPSLNNKMDVGKIEVWDNLDGFAPSNRYILISSCLNEDISENSLQNFSPIHWTAIIEINSLFDNPVSSAALSEYNKVQGYRFISLPQQEQQHYESVPTWLHICIPKEQSNPQIYFKKQIVSELKNALKYILCRGENETLYILLQPNNIDYRIYNYLIEEIIAEAGNNTPVNIISFGKTNLDIESDGIINVNESDYGIQDLGKDVYALMEHAYDKNEVHIPSKDGFFRMSPQMFADLSNDMTIVYRNIINSQSDDDGEGFYRGNEVTWHDIANERDCKRVDYEENWHDLIKQKLENMPSNCSHILHLLHLPGGGGSTLSRRIAWDLCASYPTLILHTISELTNERLKKLYDKCVKSLLIIVEVSDGKISSEDIQKLRRALMPKGMRALLLCISRINSVPKKAPENRLLLPHTSDMYMNKEEALKMYESYKNKLDENNYEDSLKITDLRQLATSENREMMCPFFFGLYAYGEDYKGVYNYVFRNIQNNNENETSLINILSVITMYSQSVNLNSKEASLYLFPKTNTNETYELAKEWLLNNPLVVRRENGFRICHPIIAKEILKQNNIDIAACNGKDTLVEIIIDFINRFVEYYGEQSERLNIIFREIFTHREIIDEDEQKKFSPLITEVESRERGVKILNHLRETLSSSSHYSNHLARVYLYSIIPNQDIFPEIENSRKYACEAIERAKANGESLAIHYHMLGKVYTQECYNKIKYLFNRGYNVAKVIKDMQSLYQQANSAFDMCISYDNSGYGLTGKLELIAKVLGTIKKRTNSTISKIMYKDGSTISFISNAVSQAGSLITQYYDMFDEINNAFQRAYIKFYACIDNLDKLEQIIPNTNSEKIRASSKRAIVSILMKDGYRDYSRLDTNKLQRVYDLLSENINSETSTRQDRIRWFEAYRRLDIFSLKNAYSFLMNWPMSNSDMYVCYHRYVVAFVLYAKTGLIEHNEVMGHLHQCQLLSKNAYGKRTTSTLDYLGIFSNPDNTILLSRFENSISDDQISREELNIKYRKDHCQPIKGLIHSIYEGMVNICFSPESNPAKLFYAKIPISGIDKDVYEGMKVKFYLGFSYDGFRAWDAIPYDTEASDNTFIGDFG